MKYLKYYLIFENLEQAISLLKKNSLQTNKVYDKIMDRLKYEGLVNYCGFVTKVLVDQVMNQNNYDDKQVCFDSFSKHIDLPELIISLKKLKNINYDIFSKDFPSVNNMVIQINSIERELIIKKFIKNWAPASLRKQFTYDSQEIKELYKYAYPNVFDEDDIGYGHGKCKLETLTDFEKKLIKRLGLCKDVSDWISNVVDILKNASYELSTLLDSNIKLYYQNEDYVIYKPIDYKSYSIPQFEYWCTRSTIQFENYTKFNIIIYLNLKNKSLSYFTYVDNNTKQRCIFNYTNIHVDEKECKFIGIIPEKYYPSNIK